jgi:type IV secretory pathway VirB10-like protein
MTSAIEFHQFLGTVLTACQVTAVLLLLTDRKPPALQLPSQSPPPSPRLPHTSHHPNPSNQHKLQVHSIPNFIHLYHQFYNPSGVPVHHR